MSYLNVAIFTSFISVKIVGVSEILFEPSLICKSFQSMLSTSQLFLKSSFIVDPWKKPRSCYLSVAICTSHTSVENIRFSEVLFEPSLIRESFLSMLSTLQLFLKSSFILDP